LEIGVFEGGGSVSAKFWRGTTSPTNNDSILTKKLCSTLSSSEVHFLTEKDHFAVLPSNDVVRLRLIGKRVVDFLLVITKKFFR